MGTLELGDLVEFYNEPSGDDGFWFAAAVKEKSVRGDVELEDFENCVAIYGLVWEGAENPDKEPKITLFEYDEGDFAVNYDDGKDDEFSSTYKRGPDRVGDKVTWKTLHWQKPE